MNAPAILAAPAGFVPAIAVTLWLALLGAAGAVLLLSGALAWWQRDRAVIASVPLVTPLRARRPPRAHLARLMAEVEALNTQAVSAGMAAAEAEAAVAAARARCRTAEGARERAWFEYDTAHQAYVSVAAMGMPVPPRPPVPRPREEPDPRDDVARAALATYRRGGISTEQLRQLLRHSSGWDDLDARHEREVLLRRAAEREARRRYLAAAAAERSAYQAVDVATVAARAWADEAAESAEEARLARAFATDLLRRAGSRRRPPRPDGRDGAPAPVPG